MLSEKTILGLSLTIYIISATSLYSQRGPRPLDEQPIIPVVGRLALEKHGREEWLILHTKNAEAYLITGNLIGNLKDALLGLGQNNLASLAGNQDGTNSLICEESSRYEYDKKGKKELKVEAKCIRYYNLEVTQILFVKKSGEDVPPPKRDIAEEKKLARNFGKQPLLPTIIGEIYGVISSVNLQSPIKTVEITNQDKQGTLEKINLIIGPDTRIVKKKSGGEAMALGAQAIKTGQGVIAVYSRNETKTEALFITITKE